MLKCKFNWNPSLSLDIETISDGMNYNISTQIAFRVDFNEHTINVFWSSDESNHSNGNSFYIFHAKELFLSYLHFCLILATHFFCLCCSLHYSHFILNEPRSTKKINSHSEWEIEEQIQTSYIYMRFSTTINHCHQVTSWENENTWIQYIL